MNAISRRDLLKRLTVGGLAATLPLPLVLGPGREAFEPLALRLARLFSQAHSAAFIGERYLATHRETPDASVLAARVAGDLRHYLRLSGAGSDGLRALLAAQQKEDFAAGRTVNVEGWILSLTEARLCAIAALAARSRPG